MIVMKFKLMIQSLSPLALLTIIRNLQFKTTALVCDKLNLMGFVEENLILILVILFCLIWIVLAISYFISFGAFKWNDKKAGYVIKDQAENKEASLNFFLTIVIPLLIDDVAEIQGALTFICIVLLICLLLYKTNLFYANPVLALLGYHVYEFSFVQNSEFGEKKCIGLCQGTLKNSRSIEYKQITEDVLYIRGM